MSEENVNISDSSARFGSRCTILIFFAIGAMMMACVALADVPSQDMQYAKDRQHAISRFNPELRDHCLQDFSQKYKRSVTPLGDAAFNDSVSREVYKTVFWEHSDRGVAFTLPVAAKDAKKPFAGDVACLYSVDEGDLHFQMSQQVSHRF